MPKTIMAYKCKICSQVYENERTADACECAGIHVPGPLTGAVPGDVVVVEVRRRSSGSIVYQNLAVYEGICDSVKHHAIVSLKALIRDCYTPSDEIMRVSTLYNSDFAEYWIVSYNIGRCVAEFSPDKCSLLVRVLDRKTRDEMIEALVGKDEASIREFGTRIAVKKQLGEQGGEPNGR